jgi:hypothetical protein
MERRLDPQTHRELYELRKSGLSVGKVAKKLRLSMSTVSKYQSVVPPEVIVAHDKKVSEFNYRDWADHAQRTQELYHRASSTQKMAHIELGSGRQPAILMPFSDQHIGGRGVKYGEFIRMTDEIINTPNLFVALLNDVAEYAVKLRSVAEICAQIFGPDKQDQFIEQWFNDISHKVAFATWANHDIERAEKQLGTSFIKRMMAKKVVFFDGIGHADVKVGKQVYKIAATHRFRGHSYMNTCHAGQRYMRFQGIDRELAMMGDIHQPAFNHYYDGPIERVSMVAGTLNTDSLYAGRYFSIFTQAQYPVVVLDHEEHSMVPFKNMREYYRITGKPLPKE